MPRDASARREALVLGARMEAFVEAAMAAAGWEILARNWSGGGGELDVVAKRGGELRFVEVKVRDLEDPLSDEAVTASKRTRLRRAARLWLETNDWTGPAAFLVAVVDRDEHTVRWVDDAFDG
jgi:putative endonuclease